MYDLISVGSISIDLYFKGKSLTKDDNRFHLAIGGKYVTDFFHEDVGGGGCNVASGVAKAGLRTAVFGKIGDNEYKDVILKKMTDKRVSTEFCEIEKNYFKISSILLTDSGERTIIHYETPSHLVKEFFLHDELKKAKNIYFSPLPHLSLEDKNKMIGYLKGDKTTTFVNLSVVDCREGVERLKTILDSLDVLFLNAHEFSEFINVAYDDIELKKFRINIPYLKNRIVIVTDGEKGSHGFFRDEYFYQEAIKPKKIIDTTGCGDAYTAGFIADYIKSKNIRSAMKNGARYASEKLGRIGAN